MSPPQPWRAVRTVSSSLVLPALSPDHGRSHVQLARAIREVCLVAALFLLYRAARLVTADDVQQAMANARIIRGLERAIRLPDEAALQQWLLTVPHVIGLANHYYVAVHFPATAAFLIWGYLRRPREQYLWARRLIVTQTLLALALQLLIPLAPPRMLPRFVDTMATIGPSAYEGSAAGLANQYAAMPSLHIGWAALIAVVVWRTTRAPIRWIAAAHASATVFVVIATANHWWLDGFVAAVLLGLALAIHRFPGQPGSKTAGRP